ncbi:MAG: ATP-binding cassette domain-containing protein [Vicinamibacteria bacterium]|nr:ATP-binding cassette domain-containing protein [Vicinamibacteria bacterium]
MIEYRDIHKSFDVPVLKGVDLTVEDGETLAIVGPSGTGKSVLLKTTIGLIVPDRGDVLIDGASVYAGGMRTLVRVRRQVGYVFQNAALFDSMTVYENLMQGVPDAVQKEIGRDEVLRRVCRALEDVNLDPHVVINKLPAELSGGMRKRVGLARTIVGRPRIILYDEPVTGLDPVNSAAVERLMTQISSRMGVTSLVVTHDIEGSFSYANRIALLDQGRVAFVGSPDEFRGSSRPIVRAFADRQSAAAASMRMMEDESHGGSSESWQSEIAAAARR